MFDKLWTIDCREASGNELNNLNLHNINTDIKNEKIEYFRTPIIIKLCSSFNKQNQIVEMQADPFILS